MSASALILPRRPPTLVGLRPMRPPAPTVPADEPETVARGRDTRTDASFDDTFDFDDVTERRDAQDDDEQDETTRQCAKLERDPALPETSVSPLTLDDVTRRRLEETLDDIEILDELRSGIIESSSRTPRRDDGSGPGTQRLDLAPGRHTDTRRVDDEQTRVETSRARAVPPAPATLRAATATNDVLARAPTVLASPSTSLPSVPVASARSGIVPVAHAVPHTPTANHARNASPMPFGVFPPAGFVPPQVHAWPYPTPAAFATTMASPGLPVAPSAVPPPATTARRFAPKRRGSRFATLACCLVAVAMATVALAESPVGSRPEVAPYAKVVRRESRAVAREVATFASAAWARVHAR